MAVSPSVTAQDAAPRPGDAATSVPSAPAGAGSATATAPATAEESARSMPKPEDLEAQLKAIEADTGLDDLAKAALSERYRDALTALGDASRFRALEADYRRALETGPEETLRLQAEIEALRNPPAGEAALPEGLGPDSSNQEIAAALSREEAAQAALRTEVDNIEEQGTELRTRPSEARKRLFEAREELTDTIAEREEAEADVARNPSNRRAAADLAVAAAREAALEAEVAMLQQEDLSDEIRRALSDANRRHAELRLEAAENRVSAVRTLAASRLSTELTRANALVERVKALAEPPDPDTKRLADELAVLIAESRRVAEDLAATGRELRERNGLRKRISSGLNDLKRLLEIGGTGKSVAPTIVDQLRLVPSERESRRRLTDIQERIAEARQGAFELDRSLESVESLEEAPQATAAGEPAPGEPPTVAELEAAIVSLRDDLAASYRRLLQELGALDLQEREIAREGELIRTFALERLFWVRSSPVMGAETFRSLPGGLAYCFGPDRLAELAVHLAEVPLPVILFGLVGLAALVVPRRWFRRRLRERGAKTRRISTDRFRHTVMAVLLTALLALPAPFVIGLAGFALIAHSRGSQWTIGFGTALLVLALLLFRGLFLFVLCRPEGVAETHFRWDNQALRRTRWLLAWLIPIHLATKLVLTLVLSEANVTYLDGLGRIAALVQLVGVGLAGALLLHPEKGIAAAVHRLSPRSLIGRFRHLWFHAFIAVILALAGLLVSGFVFTAILLMAQTEATISAVVVTLIAYGLVMRWFRLQARKLALQEALAARRARLEAAAARREEGSAPDGGEPAASEEAVFDLKEEEERNLTEVSEQTRSLVAFLAGAGLLVALWFVWTGFAPILGALDHFKPFGVSVTDMATVILAVAVTASITRNIPGLLEILVLRRLDIAVGTRNAITTLAQYLVVAIGAAVLFHKVGVDWSKFGWIAAALSVGLGFGLQEVVANFISGLIILFERPVRVGDVVTIDGIDGVVSRIQIRATTITDWNRKEFIVPNKNFITGTLLNWTLSSPVNRIVIPVGVAYGSDTGQARRILLEVACDHPRILDDPPPVATFEAFADSSLSLSLRAFVPDMDNRLATITDLHTEIDRRFKEAGIEIAFPQRDLHIRTLPPGMTVTPAERSDPVDRGNAARGS